MSAIAVLGTGWVGQSLAAGLVRAGHAVLIGSRDPAGTAPVEGARTLNVVAAISASDVVINATPGEGSVQRLVTVGDALAGRVFVDLSNTERPGTAAALQAALPLTRVVKTLNTMLHTVMAAPDSLSAPVTAFLSGDDPDAKETVRALLRSLGWRPERILDLGGIATARGPEATFPLVGDIIRARGVSPFAVSVVASPAGRARQTRKPRGERRSARRNCLRVVAGSWWVAVHSVSLHR